MPSSPRNTGPANRHGGEAEYGKRRKSFYPSSTRRDFKSSSNPVSAPSGAASPASSSGSKLPLRTDATANNEYQARSRYRDMTSSGNSYNSSSSRPNSYSKDPRYSSYGSKHLYTTGYYHDRPTGAYGSFSSAKRAETDKSNGASTSRDTTSRDMVFGSSRVDKTNAIREPWRAKSLPLNASKAPAPPRFNPNNIPISVKSGSNGLSTSVSSTFKKDRYDNRGETRGGRWNSYSSHRGDRSSSLNTTIPKERIRSSGLSYSVDNMNRSDIYHSNRGISGQRGYLKGRYRQGQISEVYNQSRSPNYIDTNVRSVSPRVGSSFEVKSSSGLLNSYTGQDGGSKGDNAEEKDIEVDEEDDEEEDDDEDEDEDDENDEDDDDEEDEEEDDINQDEQHEVEEELAHGVQNEGFVDSETHVLNQDAASTNGALGSVHEHEITISGTVDLTHAEIETQNLDNPVIYPSGCLYPLTKLESEYQALTSLSETDKDYLQILSSVGKLDNEFESLPFYSFNIKSFLKNRGNYIQILQQRFDVLRKRKLMWASQYQDLSIESDARRTYMGEQIKVLHPPEDDVRRELEAIDVRVKDSDTEIEPVPVETHSQSGRRGRRHGDLVTTEAEFEEILQTLKKEQNEDPVARARQVAAVIPELILDPFEKQTFKFLDSNNIVHDKSNWEDRITGDFRSNFTEAEHNIFCDAFCRSPKRFGEISRNMGGIRSFGECVMHYYVTKKAVNYKVLVSQYRKKISNKIHRRKKKLKAKSESSAEEHGPSSSTLTSSAHKTEDISLRSTYQNTEDKIAQGDHEKRGKHKADDSHAEEPPQKKLRHGLSENTDLKVTAVKNESPDEKPFLSIQEATSKNVENMSNQMMVSETTSVDSMSAIDPMDDKRNPKHISSYWSITEVEMFPNLLGNYGSQWSLIAEKLATKSITMVKNYFHRKAEKNGWNKLVAKVDGKRKGNSRKVSNSPDNVELELSKSSNISTEEGSQHPNEKHESGGNDSRVNKTREGQQVECANSEPETQEAKSPVLQENDINGSIVSLPESMSIRAETQKPSISSLLNNEAPPTKKSDSLPSACQKTNNLSLLLNTTSSSSVASTTVSTEIPEKRRSSIKSLLE